MEPVYTGTVHQGRELPGTHTQRGPNWREAQNNFQLPAHSVNEEGPAVFLCVLDACTFDLISDTIDDIVIVVIGEKTGNFTRGQKIVDDHQELLVWDLGISEEKNNTNVLKPRLDVELSQVCL